jgi:phage/plasmid primase-like uncharacterized protein
MNHADRMNLSDLLGRLNGVRRSGAGWSAFCPAHADRRKRSLSVRWVDNVILLYCFVGCTIEAICTALGLKLGDLFTHGATVEPTHQWSLEQRREYARDIWRHSQSAIGTLVQPYLISRGIAIAPPSSIRFVALRRHVEFGWSFPVLLAGLQDRDGRFSGVSITWLANDGSGKAPADPVRKTYGVLRGASVRLGPASEILAICEGLETGLSIAQVCPELPVWCALSASNLPRVELPAIVREVIIAADADEAGEAAAQAAARRFLREGREIVRIARTGQQRTDFNDLISR